MNYTWAAKYGAGLSFAGILFLFSIPSQAQSGPPSIFKANCAECHGADGGANTAMGRSLKLRDLRSPDVQKRTDADLTDLITNGLATMPAFKDKLTKDQIQQVVAYIRQIAKK
jgi:mono/diheme cytochrome c family protein